MDINIEWEAAVWGKDHENWGGLISFERPSTGGYILH